ncbi:MAG TPA: 3-hydroxyacyl-CoA dehydrogenase NAD-binding domain-containing protein, partial [Myxococcales bacterium]|nr:3-hydroxyacyl-CoA dehydrogenase NAD-binding domain-containing protein [Myxococcales bacterium]
MKIVDVKTLAVVGAGQMGAGIAQAGAQSGLHVLLIDVSPELVEKGLAGIRAQLDKAVGKGKLKAEDAQAALARLRSGVPDDARSAQFAV